MKRAVLIRFFGSLFVFAAIVAPFKSSAAVGDLYVPVAFDNAILKFTPSGTRTLFATATFPQHIAFDASGNLYVSQFGHGMGTGTILKITPAGVKTTFASGLTGPSGLAFDPSGNLFVSDGDLYKITPAGVKTVFISYQMNPLLLAPEHLKFDHAGNLFVGTALGVGILKITPAGVLTQFVNDGAVDGLAIDAAGNVFAAYFGRIGQDAVTKYAPNGSKTPFASVTYAEGVVVDTSNNVFVGSATQSVFKITPAGVTTTFATNVRSGGRDLAFELPTGALANISTRASVQTGNRVLIAGFIVTGTGPKQVIIRGLGPTLTNFGVTNVLQNPVLQLSNGASVVAANDDWQNAANAGQIPTSPVDYRPPNSKESAILATLQPGSYTAALSGSGSTTGNGLIEVYDLSQAGASQLANISTRGFVGAGDSIMSAGIIANGGNGSIKIMVRALGPTLTQFGLSGVLADPMLTLVDANGNVVAFNDNWKNTQQPMIQSSSLAPPNDLESAILSTLTNGNYTAVVSGKNNGTGVALVEMYKQ